MVLTLWMCQFPMVSCSLKSFKIFQNQPPQPGKYVFQFYRCLSVLCVSDSFGIEDLGKQIHRHIEHNQTLQHIAAFHFGSLSHDVFVLGKGVVTCPFFRGRWKSPRWNEASRNAKASSESIHCWPTRLDYGGLRRRDDQKGGWMHMNAMWR